jgi:ABC-2 type transport system permease protein
VNLVHAVRVFWVGWWMHFKILSRQPFEGVLTAIWPIINATLAYLMYTRGAHAETLLYASLGSAVASIWSSTTIAASGAIQRQRWWGTLELQVAAPTHFALVLLPTAVATSSVGIYALVVSVTFGKLVYGIPLPLEHPVAFFLAIPVAITSIGVLGFALAVLLVRYRTAGQLGNSLEYPVWLVCGLLFPLTVLPEWSRPISWALAPTWGMRALLDASEGGHPWVYMGFCVLLAAAYATIGALVLGSVLDAARRRATLSLT